MVDNKELIKRINYYEEIYQESVEVVNQVIKLLTHYDQIKSKIDELEKYYGSSLYMKDLQADENNQIPSHIKKGILSEDGVYNLLLENDYLKTLLK